MKIPEKIKLQSHHIDTFVKENKDDYKGWEKHMIFMYVEWYPRVFPGAYCLNKESVNRMADFFRNLSRSQNTEIEVVDKEKEDFVCGLCDNLINGKCVYGTDNSLDKKNKSKYNFSVGEFQKVKDLINESVNYQNSLNFPIFNEEKD